MKKKLSLLLAAMLLITALAGCNTYSDDNQPTTAPTEADATQTSGSEPAATEPVDEGPKSFSLADGGDPITLDYGKSADNLSAKALYYTATALYRAEDSGNIPDGAESYEVSEDGLTITFAIRRGMVWSDGEPLTAHDYRYGFLHLLDPASVNIGAVNYYPVKGARAYNMGEGGAEDVGVTCPDDYTLVFELERRAPTLLSRIRGCCPVREDYVKAHGESYGTSPDTYISSGPYLLKTWDYNQQLIFEKNPLYWNAGAVNITNLTWLTITDANTRMNLYDTGEVDHVSLPPAMVDQYQNELIVQYTQSGANALQLNLSDSHNAEAGRALSNANFRKALGYAIERDALCKNISDPAYAADGRLLMRETATASGKPWYEEYPDIESYPAAVDEEKAKAYLEAALEELGYSSAGELPSFTFLIFDVQSHRSYAEGMTDVWGRVLGVDKIEIKVLPIPQAIETAMSGQFDLYLAGITRDSDPYYLYELTVPGGTYYFGEWAEGEAFAEMLAVTNDMVDEKERYDALFACEQFFFEHGYIIPLWSYGSTTATRPAVGLTGYTVDAYGAPNIQVVFADVIPDSQRN